MHLLLDSWVVYPVLWEDIGSVFPAPETTRIRGREDPVEILGGHKGGRGDKVKTGTESTMWTSLCVAHTEGNFRTVELDVLLAATAVLHTLPSCASKHRCVYKIWF